MKYLTLITGLLLSSFVVFSQAKFTQVTNQTQGTPTYAIKKYVISSGGGVITGRGFTLTSSIGQIDAGHNTTGVGGFTLRGGFLQQRTDLIFKNGFE